MPDATAYDPHSVDDMNRDPERWHETSWTAVVNRFEGATREQLKQLMNMGLGDNHG